MPRLKARVDRNQNEIVKALRQAGCSVQSLAACGHGLPDLLVARNGRLWLLEVKDGQQPPSQRRLTPDQVQWRARWKSEVYIVDSVVSALQVVL